MKIHLYAVLSVVSLLGLFPLLVFAGSPDEAAVLKVTEEWQKAWDKDDCDRLAELLTDEIDIESRSLKGTFKERKAFIDAVRKTKAQQAGKMYSYVTTVTDAKVKVAGTEASVVRTYFTERTGGGERAWKGNPSTKEMRLRKQSNGEWKIYYEKY